MNYKNATNIQIGTYLKSLIDKQYTSARQFGIDCLKLEGHSVENDDIARMSNRLTQITKGNKSIQLDDLPVFSKLLGVSYEEILSAGKYIVPTKNHMSNYLIASETDEKEWEKLFNRSDNIFLNRDEYNKTVLDYAIEFNNLKLIKFLINKGNLWLSSGQIDKKSYNPYGAGTNFNRRTGIGDIDVDLDIQVKYEDRIRTDIIALAIDNGDFDFLEQNHAKEMPYLYGIDSYGITAMDISKYKNSRLTEAIAHGDKTIIEYYAKEYEYEDCHNNKHRIVYPFIGDIIDRMIDDGMPSELIDVLLDKAIEVNKNTYKRISKASEIEYSKRLEGNLIKEERKWDEIQDLLDDEHKIRAKMIEEYNEAMRNNIREMIRDSIRINEDNCLVSCPFKYDNENGLVANIIKVNSKSDSRKIVKKVEQLNDVYKQILEIGNVVENK